MPKPSNDEHKSIAIFDIDCSFSTVPKNLNVQIVEDHFSDCCQLKH